jgi:uncharacterized protein YutE (UPF0331/DUF86 family)
MLDEVRIRRKLADLEKYEERLKESTPKEMKAYLKADYRTKNVVERNLQLASDTELDVMAQLYKGLGLIIADDDLSMINNLEGTLGRRTIEKAKERRRLRNTLVYAYADGHYDEQAFEQAHDLGDIEDFGREVKKILETSKNKA